MNGSTNVQVIGGAGAFSLIVLWLLSYFLPDLMATAPMGLEAGLTILFTIAAGILFKADAGTKLLPGTGQSNCHPLAVLATALLALSMLGGCASRPQIDSISDAIVVTAADIESAAIEVKTLCGNTQPGGPCADGAIIDTRTKNQLKLQLQRAQDGVVAANRLLGAGDSVKAGARIDQVEAIIRILQDELRRRSR